MSLILSVFSEAVDVETQLLEVKFINLNIGLHCSKQDFYEISRMGVKDFGEI